MAQIERFIDRYMGGVFCFLLGWFYTFFPFKMRFLAPRRILFVKLWALGESVLVLPLIKSVKDKYPDAKISVLARNRNAFVFDDLPFVDEVILFEPGCFSRLLSGFRKFDLCFDCEPYLNLSALLSWFLSIQRIGFSHGIRSWLYTHKVNFNDKQHEVLAFMDLAGAGGIKQIPEKLVKLSCPADTRAEVDDVLTQEQIERSEKIVGFCVGSAESAKHRIWPARNFARLADRLVKEKKAQIIFVGSPAEKKYINYVRSLMKFPSVNLAGESSKKGLFCFAEICDLFISNDTGPMHVAAAQGTKTIGLFGPNLSVRFAPFGRNNVSIEKFLPCRPCINVHKGEFPVCRLKKKGAEGYCMRLISVDDVFNEAAKII